MRKTVVLALLLFVVLPLQARQVAVEGMRIWSAPDHVRLVFDSDAPIDHKVLTLAKPNRVVIDLKGARLTKPESLPKSGTQLVKQIRTATRNGKDVRVVLDVDQTVRPKSFPLKPNRQYGHRLVVDLYYAQGKSEQNTRAIRKTSFTSLRDVVIAIDAGHGGEDPGAIGPRGTREKDAVLAIARRLEALISNEKGMRPVMIRDGDYYLRLRNRMEKAREARADLFVSIHADAFRDRRVRGLSVYTLSERGASSEAARWLAAQENSADLIGGVSLEDKDDILASVLLDLSQTATMQASEDAAHQILKHLKKVGKAHKSEVQHAGFMVLKSPDIPSMLVETGYISNPAEERNLRNTHHQQKVADALLEGVKAYFSEYPPAGTLMAMIAPKKHVISRGDTLSTIAQRYQISLKHLRTANQLAGDRIRIGQVLTIPES